MYIEILFILNIIIDFLVLFSLNILLKNNQDLKHLVVGALCGGLMTFLVFLNINAYFLILIKLLLGVLLVTITFGYKNIIENTIYLYMISTILAGFLYYISLELSYSFITVFLIPLIIYLVIWQLKKEQRIRNLIYPLNIYINNQVINCNGYLDTGHSLKDPIAHKKIIIMEENYVMPYLKYSNPYYIPIITVNNQSLMAIYKVNKVLINNQVVKNYCIGLTKEKITISNVKALLPNYCWEDIND